MNNKANGFGTYTTLNGARYEGEWRDDHQHGKGVEILQGGAKYDGQYSMGNKDGIGKYTYINGATYEGEW